MRKITPDKNVGDKKKEKKVDTRILPRDTKALRRAIILKEILDQPISLRK